MSTGGFTYTILLKIIKFKKICYWLRFSGTKAMAKILWVFSLYTVNGRYYYLITFIFPSLRLGTRDVRTSSSLCSSAVSHPLSHTVSGKYCCNVLEKINGSFIIKSFNTASGKQHHDSITSSINNQHYVSIP